MKNVEVENRLISWFEIMMKRYTTISYKLEYSERRRVYLVNAMVDLDEDIYEQYCLDSLKFETELAKIYGDEVPLFTDNEQLFCMSANARVFAQYIESTKSETPQTKVQYTVYSPVQPVLNSLFHISSTTSKVYPETEYWRDTHQQNSYLLAA